MNHANGRTAHGDRRDSRPVGIMLSVALHLLVLMGLLLWIKDGGAWQIVAAGPGEGGEGGGGAIEVGVSDPSAILGFASSKPVSFIGDEDNPVNNTRLETERPKSDTDDEILPPIERTPPLTDSVKTDRPVIDQQEKIFTGREERGRSASATAQVGRSFGSPSPALIGGVGIGHGGGLGSGTGLPGGSEYGRRIQTILSRNYNPPSVATEGLQYVIIRLRIARDGRILSLANGRVAGVYVKQRSSLALVNNAAERAILASDPLPAFPAGFLSGVQEAVAEVWFRYPK